MLVYKNKDNCTWYVMMQYTDWKGERKPRYKSIEITYRYAHLFPSKQKEMAVKLDFMNNGV